MINKENILKAYDELCTLITNPSIENADKVLLIIHNQIMDLCSELTEDECLYLKVRYEELLYAKSYSEGAFKKVYYSVISETCSKLKMIR